MTHSAKCQHQEFSVSGTDAEALLGALAPLGVAYHEIVDREPKLIILVALSNCDPDPHRALREVQTKVRGLGHAQRAFRDDNGAKLLPTGTIQIRFNETPTDKDMNAFSKRAGLRVLERNEFQPAQAAFEPVDADNANLEEEIGKVVKHPEVRKAWPEVLSKYHRSSR